VASQLRGGTLRRAREYGPDRGASWGFWGVPATAAVAAFAARILVVLRGDGFHALAGYDQGVYYAAADAFVHGRRPYGGFLLLHPPGIMLFLSPFAALGSVTSDATGMAVARFAVILLGTLNAILVTRIALRFGTVAAIVGGLFYALWVPVVVLETQTKLEPLGNTSVLLALLGLLRRRAQPISARAEVLAGAALGAGAGVKIWGVLPLLVVLGWQLLDRGWRSSCRVAAGAMAAVTAICLPFFLMAPDSMFRMVVTDQLNRPAMRIGVIPRLYGLTAVDIWMRYSQRSVIIATAVGTLVLTAVVLTWYERSARVVVVLLVAQTALLLTAPSYFPAYTTFVIPAVALILAVASGRVALWLAPRARVLRIAGVGVLSATVVVGAVLLMPIKVGAGPPFDGTELGAVAGQERCVLSDTPIALIEMNVLSRDLRNGCKVRVDVTGYTYEGELALGPNDQVLARPKNAAWQKQVLSYLTSGNAVLLARQRGTGLSHASRRDIARWPVLAKIDGYTLFARGPQT
jgi:alpha-1,2-mannosyltransferase